MQADLGTFLQLPPLVWSVFAKVLKGLPLSGGGRGLEVAGKMG